MSEHGTRARFVNQKCRCLPCRAANARYQAERERKLRQGEWDGLHSSTEARRMIRGLITEGFTKIEIARRMGLTKIHIKPCIRARTERRLEAFYDYYTKEAA